MHKTILAVLALALGAAAQDTTCTSKRYENGSVEREFCTVGGSVVGVYKWYYEDGSLLSEAIYENDMRNGIDILYYRNGIIKSGSTYVNDKLQWSVTWFYSSGEPAGTATYKDDKLVGYVQCTDGRKGNASLDCTK